MAFQEAQIPPLPFGSGICGPLGTSYTRREKAHLRQVCRRMQNFTRIGCSAAEKNATRQNSENKETANLILYPVSILTYGSERF